MTDIVVSDGVEYDDDCFFLLGNQFTETAVATDTFAGSKSIYQQAYESDAVGTDEITRLSTPITLASSGVAADVLDLRRVENCLSEAVALDTLNQLSAKSTITLADAAAAVDTILSAAHVLVIVSSATAADTITRMARTMALASDAVAASTLTMVSKNNLAFTSTAVARDTLDLRRNMSLTSDAVATDTLINVRHVLEALESAAVASDAVTAKGHIAQAYESLAVATEALSMRMTGTISLASEAEAFDAVRLPADSVPGLWTNTTTAAAATWEGLPFNSMVEVDGTVYGAGRDGIGIVTPKVDDDGLKIDAYVTWDLDDFGTPNRKRLGHVYVAGYATKPYVVTVICHQGSFDYQTRLPKGEHTTNYRADTGRGLDSSYYRVRVKAPDYFEVKAVIVDHLPTTRRI